MTDERRRHRRAQLPAIRATYETAGGDRAEGSVHDLGIGGAFVRAPLPLPVGKRIMLELAIEGEKGPITTTARVVWKRDVSAGEDQPAGMGLVFLDLDDAAQALVARLTSTRERTVIGVPAPAQESKVPATPVVSVGPRQRTAMGMGAPPEREESLPDELGWTEKPAEQPIEALVETPAAPKPEPTPPPAPAPAPAPAPPPAREKSAAAIPQPPNTRAVTWLVILVLLIIALAYLFRAQLFGTDSTAPTTTTTPTTTADTETQPPPSSPPPGSASAPRRILPRLPPVPR
jgi:uncharacterized protein (TIGR02266 family)